MLTERIVRDAAAQTRTRILWDGQTRGLGLRITPSGTKSYVLSYRFAGRKRCMTLARAVEISLKAARKRAGTELATIRSGESDPLARRESGLRQPTVGRLIERFLTDYAPGRIEHGRMTESTLRLYGRQCRRYICPALGSVRVAEVTRHDIEAAVAELKPVLRNRVLALLSRLFNLAEIWEWRGQHTNPVRGIERAREEPRDRVLSRSELAALGEALAATEARHPAPVAAIRLAVLTGLRIGEILAIRWEHVDFDSRRLLLPRTKTGRRTHDLPPAAIDILQQLPRINAWAFTVGRDAAVTYSHARKVFARVASMAGLADVRLQDLRRGFMTRAAASGVGTHLLRDLLGHKTTAMADRYIRAVGDPVREARVRVGAAMAEAMSITQDRASV